MCLLNIIQVVKFIKLNREYFMAEEMICDITHNAINNVLRKFPRKKAALREYCDGNQIADMDELTEELALEILEIMDSASYIRCMRAKKEEQQIIYHENLILTFTDYIENNKDVYMILEQVQDCYLVCKIIKIMVQTKNINSVFQPYETTVERTYFINFVVKLSEDIQQSDMINNFLSRNCKIVKIVSIDDVARNLDDVA